MGFWSSVGNAVSSAASAVGDAVEGAVDVVTDTVEDAVDAGVDWVQNGIGAGTEWVCKNGGNFLCGVGNVVGGLLDGALEGAQDIFGGALNVVRDVGGIVGSLLRLDFAGVLRGLGELVLDVGGLLVNGLRFVLGGYFVGGIVRAFEREALRDFVADLLEERFGEDPAKLDRIRERVGLDGGRFGLPLDAQHRVFVLDSQDTPLWDWHKRGVIDLYQMAGLVSFDSFQLQRPDTVVRFTSSDGIESSFPINRWTLAQYIDSNGKDGRIRVYSMSRRVLSDKLKVAREKVERMGVRLSWSDGERFSWFRSYTTHEITTEDEYRIELNKVGLGRYAQDKGLRTGSVGEDCTVLALGAFHFKKTSTGRERLGLVFGRDVTDGPASCATPGRTDRCCVTVIPVIGTGVIHRDVYPAVFMRYILAHEIGHYLGLCHIGHDGVENIMFTPAPDVDLEWTDWGTFKYYLESEPSFTLDDGKNAWRFMVDQMSHCLDPEAPAPIL